MYPMFNVKYIDEYIHEKKITKDEFCKMINVRKKSLDSIYKGGWEIGFPEIVRICICLDITLSQFIFKDF